MKRENTSFDYLLFFVFILLVCSGLLMVFSSSMVLSTYFYKDGLYFFKKQIFSFFLGIIFFTIFLKLRLNFLEKISSLLLIISIIFLIAVFIPGIGKEIKGVNRWIDFGPFSFQPSEMAKFSLILFLSSSLSKRREKIKNFFQGLLSYLLIFSLIFILVMEEPNLGTAFIILVIFFVMMFAGGVRVSHLILLSLLGVIAVGLFIKKENYRIERLKAFYTPLDDIQDTDYQAWQSLIALGSGKLKGMGLGQGRQKYLYLPQPHTDFIYAMIGEEFGFIGTVTVIILFLLFFWRGCLIAVRAPTLFASLLSFGLTFYIVFQGFLNMAVVIGLLPVTGVPLPFVSYGGTSLILAMSSTGIILNISEYKIFQREIYENNNFSRRDRRTSLPRS